MSLLVSDDVFPRRNLPELAEPWGRKHDDVLKRVVRAINTLDMASSGNNRSMAGQLGVLGRQVEELQNRSTHITNVAMITVDIIASGTTYTNWYSKSIEFSFPGPVGGSRSAILSVTSRLSTTMPPGVRPVTVAGLKDSSGYLWQSDGLYIGSGTGDGKPSGWPMTVTTTFPVKVPGGGSAKFTFELQGSMYGATNTTVSTDGMVATLWYGDRY